MRYVIRPEAIHRTPRLLAQQAKIKVTSYHDMIDEHPDWKKDFFMYHPPVERVVNGGPEYAHLRQFYCRGKHNQRRDLRKAGQNVLDAYINHAEAKALPDGETYVVRPYDHSKGEGYRLTKDKKDFKVGEEYIAAVFPKTHEYRVVFVRGKLTFLQKKDAGDRGPEDCWSNTAFDKIEIPRSYLNVHTDALTKLQECGIIQESHIVGVDILYNHKTKEYRIAEFNTCPSLAHNLAAEGKLLRQLVIDNME